MTNQRSSEELLKIEIPSVEPRAWSTPTCWWFWGENGPINNVLDRIRVDFLTRKPVVNGIPEGRISATRAELAFDIEGEEKGPGGLMVVAVTRGVVHRTLQLLLNKEMMMAGAAVLVQAGVRLTPVPEKVFKQVEAGEALVVIVRSVEPQQSQDGALLLT